MEIINKLPEVLSNPTLIMVVAALVEFGMRYVKTEKPLSVIKIVVVAVKGVATALNAVSDFADKVLGQRLK